MSKALPDAFGFVLLLLYSGHAVLVTRMAPLGVERISFCRDVLLSSGKEAFTGDGDPLEGRSYQQASTSESR
jgi:hypothetical protein